MLLILWEHFRDGPFLFQHHCALVFKAWFIKRLANLGKIFHWLCSLDFYPIENLWDEQEVTLHLGQRQCFTSQVHFW